MAHLLSEEMIRAAVAGLGQTADLDSLVPEHLAQLYHADNFRSGAERFLQLMTLHQLEQSIARLPVPGDAPAELPAEPEPLLTPLDQNRQAEFARLPRQQIGLQPLLACFLAARRALPDDIAIDMLRGAERGSHDLSALPGSARLRWMLSITPEWSKQLSTQSDAWIAPAQRLLCSPNDELTSDDEQVLIQTLCECRPALRAWLVRLLGRQSPAQISRFVRGCWDTAKAELRALLVQQLIGISEWLASPQGQEMQQWLRELPTERATSVRQQLALLLTGLDARTGRLDEESPLYLALSECITLKAGKAELQAPEQLTPELTALGVADTRAHANSDISKPASRLGQLVRLGGPTLWSRLLDCNADKACELLLNSRYQDELLPFILDSLFLHREGSLFKQVYQATYESDRPVYTGIIEQVAVQHVNAHSDTARWFADIMERDGLWQAATEEASAGALLAAGVRLTPATSRAWLQHFDSASFASLLLLDLASNDPAFAPHPESDDETYEQRSHRNFCQRIRTAMAFREALTQPASTMQGEHA